MSEKRGANREQTIAVADFVRQARGAVQVVHAEQQEMGAVFMVFSDCPGEVVRLKVLLEGGGLLTFENQGSICRSDEQFFEIVFLDAPFPGAAVEQVQILEGTSEKSRVTLTLVDAAAVEFNRELWKSRETE